MDHTENLESVIGGIGIILCLLSLLLMSAHAIIQYDLKKIVAYSSISHMALCLCAILYSDVIGKVGGASLMLGHTITSASMFYIVGLLYNRYHSRNVKYYGGLVLILPLLSSSLLAFMFVNSGLPLTINFIPEFLSFTGVIQKDFIIGALMTINVFLTPVYSIILTQKVIYGKFSIYINYSYQDLTSKEGYMILCFIMFSIIAGIFPNSFLYFLNSYYL